MVDGSTEFKNSFNFQVCQLGWDWKENVEDACSEIFNEFKTINEVSEGLNVLKIVINYAKATSADPEEKMSSFMKKLFFQNSMKNYEMVLKLNVIKDFTFNLRLYLK